MGMKRRISDRYRLRPAPALAVALLLAGCGEGRQAAPPAPQAAAPAIPGAAAGRNLDPAQLARGAEVYGRRCAECHGKRGEATPNWRTPGPDGRYPPPPLDDSAHAWHHPTEALRRVIRNGSPPGMGNMPAWEGKLSERDIDDVIAFIQSLWSDEVHARWRQIEKQSRTN